MLHFASQNTFCVTSFRQIFYDQNFLFFFKSDRCLECDSAYWWSRQHSGMQVSGWGLNMELTKDDCILNQMETVWGENNEDILWTRPDPESVSRASALSTEFWQWNNAQIKGKIKVWERENKATWRWWRGNRQKQPERKFKLSELVCYELTTAPVCPFTIYEAWNEESMILCGKTTSFKHVATLQNYFTSNYMK